MFKYHRQNARLARSRAAASVESKMATMQHKIFACAAQQPFCSQLTLLHGCALGERSRSGI